ncbi:AAA family ATPase [Candidatus Roizmanbacteria bacterium CG_4_9_14_0_8_um_filter_34_12]|uniref:AAA family ATPase n=3 Tax=Candidatus Roizmaniibacteriota TaxID=1752723 RepID=A0A2M7BXZ3_9BACT|nr:ATP-binding protein [Candidatus Roizmanbacteria bacterium]PIV11437.1 MAG: AAA family ATPase [Candidatus Roizmanbacteria bacterium CG03_land_8_20_14_0_80_35_26]PIX69323.1 MAG: AAA family ATPase [Candidatus Roizmanbacteria bacterium CG_4_10_14_3_um_filter_33_21]PJB87614.1 MAG: AAA family ATPase [Candidatus Roizmanbacteria bacterium CG_4_9_14_0_8_um_filter_34_12]
MIINRILIKSLSRAVKQYPVLFITGPRQSGKTTISKKVFNKFIYKNLEDPETRLFAKNDPKNFLSQADKIIIDEIQRVPELLSYIQVMADADNKKKFVITGSQNILVSQKVSQSLAGRVAIFNLLPFSFKEIINTSFGKKDIYEQVIYGFYPRIYDKLLDPIEWFPNYIQTYLERDVREIKNISSLIDFQRFLKLCAGRTGQILNLSSLANDLGAAVNTIKGWLSVLEATFIIYLVPPFYKNFNKRIIKSPKLYFYDTGLVCSLLAIKNEDQLKTHPLYGNIFETLCVSEVVKQNYNNNLHINFYYWRDKSGNEVDLLYEKNNKINAVEIKSSSTFSQEFIKELNYLERITKDEINKKVIYSSMKNTRYKDVLLQGWRNIKI